MASRSASAAPAVRLHEFALAHPRVGSAGILLVIVALWQVLFAAVFTDVDVVATPSEIVSAISDEHEAFRTHLVTTAQEAAVGLVLGVGAALVLALVSLTARPVEDNVFHLAVVVNSLPLIVLAPLLVIWFGTDQTPRIVLAALAVFFGVLVNAVRGLKAVSPESRELFEVLGANPLQVLWRLRVPSSLPFVMSSLRVAVVASVLGAVIGEWVGATKGLGVVLVFSLYQLQTAQLWAAMVLLTALALAGYLLVSLAERFVIPWHESVKRPRLEIGR